MLQFEMITRLLVATILGGIIGYEREVKHRPAGFRTHILVAMGSAVFTTLSLTAFPGADSARVASYIVMGIGFIGAGTVLQVRDKVLGLTTAASLWITAAIGMAIGTGYYLLAIVATVLTYLILSMKTLEKEIHSRKK